MSQDTKLYVVQPSMVTDDIHPDGHEGKQLPWSYGMAADGTILSAQNKYAGRVRAVGFMRSLRVREIDLWWADAVKDLSQAVGMYFVFEGADGEWGIEPAAIMDTEIGERP